MKKLNSLFLIATLILGCQTRPVTSDAKICDPSRNPASSGGQCSRIFADSLIQPSTKEFEDFFSKIEDFGISQWNVLISIEKGYIERNQSKNDAQMNDPTKPLRSVTTGEALAKRRILNESTAKILTEIGFRETGGQLMPPRNLPKLYEKIYERIIRSAREGGLPDNDIILPAFLFFRSTNTGTQETLFVRPGIDPIPKVADGWQLSNESHELSSADFSRMVREKKFLLEPGMFFHDIGHIVDFIERPQYMKAYRLYHERKASFGSGNIPPSLYPHLLGQVSLRGDMERYFNEWLYLPSSKNITKIKEIISNIDIDVFTALPNIQSFYLRRSSSELLKTAKTFLKERYTLFSSHGGGARDWSVERYTTPEDLVRGFKEIMLTEGTALDPDYINDKERPFSRPDRDYWMQEAPGIFERMEQLAKIREGKEVPVAIHRGLEELAEKSNYRDFITYIDRQIAYHLAEIQFRVQTALVFRITPEQIASDTALLYERKGWEKYRTSATSKFYSTYKPYTVQWILGYDIGRSNPNYKYIEWPSN